MPLKEKLVVLALALVIVSFISTVGVPITTSSPTSPRGPISINGNGQFTSANGVTSGSGTTSDPYIIGNWVISASSAHGIYIKNTTAYFIVRNCLVENGGGNNGIYLDNATNGRVENNTCRNNYYGIYLIASSNNTLTNNTCTNNSYGIHLFISRCNILTGNTCRNNTWYGIYLISLTSPDNNTLTNNTCENNDIGICLGATSNNTIALNYLLNNTENNAYDSGTNSWDNGSVGNYWSDWQPSQHPDVDNNGIVDQPRSIAGGSNYDHYPLVIPVVISDFTIGVSPSSGSIVRGASTMATVAVTKIGTFSDTVSLSASGVPSGVSISFSPLYGAPNFTSTMTVSVGNTATPGTYPITITGTGAENTFVRTCTYTLTVVDNNVPPNTHAPISIISNSQFTSANGVVSGSGTQSDPYIIGNWVISASSADGILIQNTTAYFIVRNCLVENGAVPYHEIYLFFENGRAPYDGIYLINVINGRIENNICRNNFMGIYLYGSSSYNTLTNNICSNNYTGIHLYSSSNNTLTNNICSNNRYGIMLSVLPNNTLTLNYLLNNSWYNAYEETSGTNNWDNGSVGNYWSDWQSPDTNPHDGIVDNPRPIVWGSSVDHYPLVILGIPIKPATSLVITPSTFTSQPGGSTTLTATLTSNGAPLAGKTIFWNATSGGVVPPSVVTNSLGQVSVTYAAPYHEDNVMVTATFVGDNEYQSSIYSLSGVIETTFLQAIVDIKPDTLQIGSGYIFQIGFVTCYIELPNDNVSQIDVSSILLDGRISVNPSAPTEIGDYDNDGAPDLMVRFNISSVESIVSPGPTILTVTGRAGGLPFIGSDTIDVIRTQSTSQALGGLVSVVVGASGTEPTVRHDVFSFNLGLSADINNGVVRVTVSSENSAGQTIVVDIFDNVIKFESLDDVTVLFDNQKISMANSYEDVLDPTNENVPEYLVLLGGNGVQLLISVPHFSAHAIDIGKAAAFVTSTEGIPLATILAVAGVVLIAAISAAWVGLRHARGDATSELIEHGLSNMSLQEADIFREIRSKKEFIIPELMNKTGASMIFTWRTVQKLIEKGLVKPTGNARLSAAGRGKPSVVYKYTGD